MKIRKYLFGISALLFIAAIVVFINHRNEIDNSRDIYKSFNKANEQNENIDGWDNRKHVILNVDKTFSVRSWVHLIHGTYILPTGEEFVPSNMPVEVIRVENDEGQINIGGFIGPFWISCGSSELPDSTFNYFLTAQLELWEYNIYPKKDLDEISLLWNLTVAEKEWNDITNSYLYVSSSSSGDNIIRAIKLDKLGCIKEVILSNDVSIIWGSPFGTFLNPRQNDFLPDDYLTDMLISRIKAELFNQRLNVWYIPGKENYHPIYTYSELRDIWQPRFYIELILCIGALVLLIFGFRNRSRHHKISRTLN